MRLIDADKLQEVITQDLFLDILLVQNGKTEIEKRLVDMIDSVPLAYDVEKVMAELKKHKEVAKYLIEICVKDCVNQYDLGRYVGMLKAIEIVRRGGIDG